MLWRHDTRAAMTFGIQACVSGWLVYMVWSRAVWIAALGHSTLGVLEKCLQTSLGEDFFTDYLPRLCPVSVVTWPCGQP